jgi:hypothetical protein
VTANDSVFSADVKDSTGDPEPVGELHRALDDSTVALALTLVKNMAVIEEVTTWSDEDHKGPGGRPELFSKHAVLVGMVLCVLTDQPLHLRRVYDVLFRQLDQRWRTELGLPDPPAPEDVDGRKALYRDVRTRFHTIIGLMDPSTTPKNRRLDPDVFSVLESERRARLSAGEWSRRAERLEWFANQILEASICLLPREHRRKWKGSIGVDATVVRSFARRDKREDQPRRKTERAAIIIHSADPDAGVYYREPDDRDDDGHGGYTHEKDIYGYEATLAITGPDDVSGVTTFPSLALGMAVLHRPGVAPGKNGTKALANVRRRGHPANWLAADIAYSSAKAEDFQLPARALGYKPVFAYKEGQFGVKANVQGFLQVEGAWYCPMMPRALVEASADRRAGRVDEVVYRQRIAERRQYSARRKQQPDAEGHERLQCPAAGTSPLARCELKPRSVTRRTQGSLRIHPDVALQALPPPCCTQETVTVPPVAGAKFAQDLPYKSSEWQATYNTIRNANEGFNGYVKDAAHEALDDADRRRIHGVAAQTVFAAMLLMAANVRKIRAFLEDVAQQARKLKRLPRRRRTKSLETWLPEGVPHIEMDSDPDPPSTD